MPEIGRATVNVKTRFTSTHKKAEDNIEIAIGIFKDFQWEQVADNKKIACDVKAREAYQTLPILVPVDGSYSQNFQINITNQLIPRIFYFAAMDCNHLTHSKSKHMPKIEMEFEIFLNVGDSYDHFSYEEEGTLQLHLVLLVLFALIFGLTVYSYYQYQKQFERYDSPHFIMALALFFQMSGIFMQTLHLWMYSHNGRGIPIFDIFGLIGCMMSEISVSCLFMMIAHGWTLIYQDLDFDNNLEIYLPVGSIVVAVHLVLAAMTYVDLDAHHKYHDFAGVQGWVLILFKVGLFAYYIYCVCQNIEKIPKKSTRFHRVFTLLGCVYMLNVPLTIIACYFFQPYNRQFLYTMSTNVVQAITLGSMLQQQSSNKSGYKKASMESDGILPMNKFE
ncbi:integral membrane protein gpr180-like [Stylonychia lemnae]|uniref:Integral membrane protein gpr180-like n=1 Tax=Stylonychia lemnae TaxID=5949 RepID=A0A077ZPG4_STYLE|nr:integral membrane protein gpr180-like [Stylonychia lemnae]|eukprot:CDW71798.1 integral membrane protein gpr180-like [Stylonychia lemnae]